MADSPVRVALLARPGTACEHLQAALQQAGAEVVLVADPLGSDAGSVAAAAPAAVLVALEPAVEDVLDRYDPVLLDPAMTVIYDEAEIAARREGWDAARWTRHLAAKLAGHGDVLPPGAGGGTTPVETPRAAPEPAAPEPARAMSIEPMAFEPVPTAAAVAEPDAAEPAAAIADDDASIGFTGIVPDGELSLDALDFELAPNDVPAAPAATTASAPEADAERPTFDFSALSLEDIPDVAVSAPAAQAAPEPEPEPEPAIAAEVGTPGFQSPEVAADPGAVVVLAGIGGPDAVRQFLAALPEGFPRPVLVRQRLDGGRHDRLVRQMQRATSLPVELAESGATLVPGHVYILPDGMAAEVQDGRSRFVPAPDPVPVLAGLPASGSAILVLSGSDPGTVDDVLAAGQAGAIVAGQAPEECFDAVAPAALIAGGAEGGAPSDLAVRLAAHWPH